MRVDVSNLAKTVSLFLSAFVDGNLTCSRAGDCNCDHSSVIVMKGVRNVLISDPDGCISVTVAHSGRPL